MIILQRAINNDITNTCEGRKGCEQSYWHQEINICHSLDQDQVAEGTHSDHLSTQ